MYKARISDMNEDDNNYNNRITVALWLHGPGHYRAKLRTITEKEGRTKEKGRLPRESSTRTTAVALSIVLSRKADFDVG